MVFGWILLLLSYTRDPQKSPNQRPVPHYPFPQPTKLRPFEGLVFPLSHQNLEDLPFQISLETVDLAVDEVGVSFTEVGSKGRNSQNRDFWPRP